MTAATSALSVGQGDSSALPVSQEPFRGFGCKWARSQPVLICICSPWTRIPSQVRLLCICNAEMTLPKQFLFSTLSVVISENPPPKPNFYSVLIWPLLPRLPSEMFLLSPALHSGLSVLRLLPWGFAASCPLCCFPSWPHVLGPQKAHSSLLKDQDSGNALSVCEGPKALLEWT